ncbi:multidrug effflux MFS transporter [Lacticaseibacillus zhaodongensis]|uniref:multidrug effflux MFS transporter n=1 Tax=Lacticaseibacillus zhaodongensis TaxID=2668065 RepID=UPI0012D2E058|nr:multidrug effflux MFS transporter [Lacticaseibacillus zhaodongensis]
MTERGKRPSLALGILLGTLSAFGPLSMDLYLPALPMMQTSLHTSAALAQLTITASLVGMAAGQLIFGPLSDRYGRRKPLLAGLILFAVCSLLIAWQSNIWVLIGLRVLQGVGGSAGQVLSRSIARDFYSGAQLTRFMALLMAINGIFPIISPSIGSLVLMATSWRGIFVLLALIGVFLLLASWFMLPETLHGAERSRDLFRAFRDMVFLLKDRAFMTYVIAQGFAYGALFSYISGSSFVYERYYGVPVLLFSILYAVNGLGIVVGTNAVGRLSGRYSTQKLMAVALIGGVAAGGWLVINALTADSLLLMIIGLILMQVFFGGVNATATSLGMDAEPQRAGGASALLGLGSNAIAGLASPLVGLFGARDSLPMVSLILGSSVLALITFTLGLRPKWQRT